MRHSKRWSYLSAFVLLLALSLIVGNPLKASADVNDFTVQSFNSDETLSNTTAQGQLHIVEHITVNFTDNNHGIERAIPNTYKNLPLNLHVNNISSDTGASAEFTSYQSNGNTVLRIGNPTLTVTGIQEYTIDYTLAHVITIYNSHDELYWNVNGTGWNQPFESTTMSLHVPKNITVNQTNLAPICYSGAQHSTVKNCIIRVQLSATETTVNVQATQLLPAGSTLTYVAAFPVGSFRPVSELERYAILLRTIAEITGPTVVLGGAAFVTWLKIGRDPKGQSTIIPEYDAPDGLSPLEVGTVYDFKTDDRDITATIIDLAIRGYVKIIETDGGGILGHHKNFSLQLLKTDYALLNTYETQLLSGIFHNEVADTIVEVASLKTSFYSTAKAIKTTAQTNMIHAGYFRAHSLQVGSWLISGTIFIGFGLFYVINNIPPALICGLVLALIVVLLFARSMASRTAKGVTAEDRIKGLKLYLEVAEKDRFAKLQSVNSPYSAQYTEPIKTVNVYEKLLPYAMVLGVENSWSKQFTSIYTQPPSWYGGGNWSTFNTIFLIDSLNSGFAASMNNSYTAPRSSGGSGFSGGFAGGGGGGGGGGGW
jgi:uncharacterized membrane protein